MNQREIDRMFYKIICSEPELERVLNVQNGSDFLLKLRADTILDHMRLQRVFMNLRKMGGEKWSLEKSFDGSHFINFTNCLNDELKAKCKSVTFGNIFSTEPNGQIFNTEFGPITTLCNSLRYFLKFMHLALFQLDDQVPMKVRINALIIAIRIMLKSESLDFLMDPRGIIPKKIDYEIERPIPFQLQFIAGHEYAHFILGHISDTEISEMAILRSIRGSQSDYGILKCYNTSQKNEFEADLASINLPNYSNEQRQNMIEAALMWYACLDVYEAAELYIYPPTSYMTHPNARDRYFNILDSSKGSGGIKLKSKYWYEDVISLVDTYKAFLIEDVSLHIETYEIYGSVYLDAPNTEWRGKELIDRKDYY